MYVNFGRLAVLFAHRDRNGRVEARTERDAGCTAQGTADLEYVNNALSQFGPAPGLLSEGNDSVIE
jgi:hypothetical protein